MQSCPSISRVLRCQHMHAGMFHASQQTAWRLCCTYFVIGCLPTPMNQARLPGSSTGLRTRMVSSICSNSVSVVCCLQLQAQSAL